MESKNLKESLLPTTVSEATNNQSTNSKGSKTDNSSILERVPADSLLFFATINRQSAANDLFQEYTLLTERVKTFKHFLIVNWVALLLTLAIGALIFFETILWNSTKICWVATGWIKNACLNATTTAQSSHISNDTVTILFAVIFGCFLLLFYYGIRIFNTKNAKAIRKLYFMYLALLALFLTSLNVLGVALFAYLAYQASKLVKLFGEVAKTQMEFEKYGVQF